MSGRGEKKLFKLLYGNIWWLWKMRYLWENVKKSESKHASRRFYNRAVPQINEKEIQEKYEN